MPDHLPEIVVTLGAASEFLEVTNYAGLNSSLGTPLPSIGFTAMVVTIDYANIPAGTLNTWLSRTFTPDPYGVGVAFVVAPIFDDPGPLLVAIPEPASAAVLLALGTLLVAATRRRRSRSPITTTTIPD